LEKIVRERRRRGASATGGLVRLCRDGAEVEVEYDSQAEEEEEESDGEEEETDGEGLFEPSSEPGETGEGQQGGWAREDSVESDW
jgi:hypothetical protein